ncbi:hypothetical protein [Lactiplantibacillus herbarum]|uniref:hypothetical protein n=1 Tax=Lactiplantibacillus herbarum TaxID=1670446 RepID=UPI00064FC36B|nr:hypothetical protein [Lactiplantibacillus herbarum]
MERWKILYRQPDGASEYGNIEYVTNNGFCQVQLKALGTVERLPLMFKFKDPIYAVHEHDDIFQEHQNSKEALISQLENDSDTILFEIRNSELKHWLTQHKFENEDTELKGVHHYVIRTRTGSVDVLCGGIKKEKDSRAQHDKRVKHAVHITLYG